MTDPLLLGSLLACVALLYSMVGHGGASGYLAVLSLASFSPAVISSNSLVLNLFVAGISFAIFAQAKHFRWSLTWPFLVSAVPLAFFGAMFKIPESIYSLLLAALLLYAVYRLLFRGNAQEELQRLSIPKALAVGSVIGLVSGMLGIGGGIFLSPVLLLSKWAKPKETAATSAVFIFINSLAGLGGKLASSQLQLSNELVWFVPTCIAGALIGSYLGAKKLPAQWIRFALSAVLLSAVLKLALQLLDI